MAAPSQVASANGGTDAGGAWTLTAFASGEIGRLFVLHILQDGATNGAVAVTGSTDINDLAGAAGMTQIAGTNADGSHPVGASGEARQFVYIGRATNAISVPTLSGTNSTSEDLYYMWTCYDDVSTGTTLATVIENGTAGTSANGVGTSSTAADTAVTTLGPDRLAMNLVAVNDDNAISEFTGESGGDWAMPILPFAESSGTDGALGTQIATITSAATINGGTGSITDSDAWGVVGFALIGTTPSGLPAKAGTGVLL